MPVLRRASARAWWLPITAVGAATAAPRGLRLGGLPGVLHLLAFRTLTGAGSLALAAVAALGPRATRSRPAAGALLGVAAVHLGTQLRRGWSRPAAPGPTDLVVLSFNTLHGEVSPADLAETILTHDVAMAALPETSRRTADATVALLAERGAAFTVFDQRDGIRGAASTVLLLRADLGDYRQADAPYMLLGGVRAEPVSGTGPVLVAVHPGAPVPGVGLDTWRRTVAAALQAARGDDVIVAGDFNTTLDHPPLHRLGGLTDAATEAGRGAEGTWPAHFPCALASPIDHVLISAAHWRCRSFRTLRIGGSDHRALVVQLARRR